MTSNKKTFCEFSGYNKNVLIIGAGETRKSTLCIKIV